MACDDKDRRCRGCVNRKEGLSRMASQKRQYSRQQRREVKELTTRIDRRPLQAKNFKCRYPGVRMCLSEGPRQGSKPRISKQGLVTQDLGGHTKDLF
jgi:hypothetical protein